MAEHPLGPAKCSNCAHWMPLWGPRSHVPEGECRYATPVAGKDATRVYPVTRRNDRCHSFLACNGAGRVWAAMDEPAPEAPLVVKNAHGCLRMDGDLPYLEAPQPDDPDEPEPVYAVPENAAVRASQAFLDALRASICPLAGGRAECRRRTAENEPDRETLLAAICEFVAAGDPQRDTVPASLMRMQHILRRDRALNALKAIAEASRDDEPADEPLEALMAKAREDQITAQEAMNGLDRAETRGEVLGLTRDGVKAWERVDFKAAHAINALKRLRRRLVKLRP